MVITYRNRKRTKLQKVEVAMAIKETRADVCFPDSRIDFVTGSTERDARFN